MPQPKPLKHGRDGRCEICGARGPLTEISLPKKRRPVMVCIRCYRNIQMRNLYSNKDFDEDDDFQDKWMAENHSFENAVTNMLAVANHLGSVEAAREQWGAAPQVWEEVTRRFNDSFNSSNYTLGPNCKCSATLQWSDKKRAWYCVECPFNTFKDAESFEAEEPFKADRKLLKELGERFHRRFCSIIRCGPKCSLRFRESKPIPGQYVYVNTRFNQPKLEPIRTTEYDEVYYNFSPETKKKLKDWAEEQSKELGRTVKLSWNYCEGDYRSGKDIQISLPKEREKNAESFAAEDRPEEERMTRPQAEALATKMTGLLQPSCEFIEVAGSFRRGREDPGDLDIVVILKPRETLPNIVESLSGEYSSVSWVGEKKTQIIVDGVKVDIRVTTPRALGAALLYFTGPAGYNIGIRRAAKSRGMKLNEYGIFDRETNEYLGGATEEEIYEILGKNFRPATERRAETITRHLGEISDDELRWLYKNGKITKAQMHIGIGLKMDAEELQEFNSAVIFPDTYKTAGPLEKAVINNVMMKEIRLQEALLALEANIQLGIISEAQAMKAFLEITRYG